MTDYKATPARKIPIGTRSITGTMPGGSKFESTLERDLMCLLQFDINVAKFVPQPVSIGYIDAAGKARTYTPDILIYHRKDILPAKNLPIILGEVKYRDDLSKHFREYRSKFKAAYRYAKNEGWQFRLFTEREIRTPFLDNAKFLLGFLRLDPFPDHTEVIRVLERLHEFRETDVQTLLVSLCKDKWNQARLLPIVWHLIANRRIGNNLHIPITMRSRIWEMT